MNETQITSARFSLETAVRQSIQMNERLADVVPDLFAIAEACANALRQGKRVFFCGNGGSAAESQHLATEFVVRLSSQRNRPALSSIALTTDTSLLTACANDFGFDRIFARQIEAHLKAGDVLILLSTSGASPNLLEAAKTARAQGGTIAAFLGEKHTPLNAHCDLALHVPSPHSQRVQEGHLMCGHLLVQLVEDILLETPSSEPGSSR
jgi:D-sedoheptulose 7-phosphate isomerase